MRKLIAGCLVVFVLAVVATAIALYFGYRFARPYIDDATSYFDRVRDIPAIADRIENKAPFPAPENGELTESQVERFLSVQEHVRKTLGTRWSELEARATAFQEKAKASGRDLSLGEVAGIFSDLGGIFVEARAAHVDALNAQKFSSAEYRWVRLRMYEAAGLELAGSLDLSAIENMVRRGAEGTGVNVPEMSLPEVTVPEKNRALVKPHADKLKEWLPLAFLGL
jgi:hypothetical protein